MIRIDINIGVILVSLKERPIGVVREVVGIYVNIYRERERKREVKYIYIYIYIYASTLTEMKT